MRCSVAPPLYTRFMKRPPILMIIASVLAGLGIVQMTFLVGQSLYRTVSWSAQSRALHAENDQLRRDIGVLEMVRAHLNDPDYLRELARCQGFVGEGEQVVLAENARMPENGNCDKVELP